MTDTEKLSAFDRIGGIIERQVALEVHMRSTGAKWTEILNSRASAYSDIGEEVKGIPFPRRA